MAKKKKKYDSKEAGLTMSLILGRYFLNAEDLHYGFWEEGDVVRVENFVEAQKKYSEFLISKIPEGVKNILDVGGGAGVTTRKLLKKGYSVDCLTPSPDLAEEARKEIKGNTEVFEAKFQEFKSDKRYDLILFSESFQYIPVKDSLPNSIEHLKDKGYILICDFFKTDHPGKSALSGGHNLKKFYNKLEEFPLKIVENIDITNNAAPNMDVVDDFINRVARPVWDLLFKFLGMNYPFWFKLLKKIYKKKIIKTEKKFFSGKLNAEEFKKFKSYRLILLQKK